MAKNLKFLLLAVIVLFAGVVFAHGDDDDDDDHDDHEERRMTLGDGDRDCDGVSGLGFRAFKVTRTTSTGTDTVVFSFRAFPVPRVRVRYFDGEITDAEVEDDDTPEKLELIASIPGFFLYTEGDNVAGYSLSDTITQRFNLRRANGIAWAMPTLTTTVTDGVKVFKLSVCRKVGDFCFDSYVANDTTTYEGYALTADSIKFNIIAVPGSALTIADNERLAVVVKVHYKDGFEAEDNSDENEEQALAGATETLNDLAIGSTDSEIAGYFNWEKTVTVSYSGAADATLNILSSSFSADELPFDKKVSGAGSSRDGGSIGGGSSGSGDFDEASEESDEERESSDDTQTYSSDEEDDSIEGRLSQDKVFVFAIDGSLSTATKVVWDPDAGTGSFTVTASNAAGAISITLAKVLVAAFAILAFFM